MLHVLASVHVCTNVASRKRRNGEILNDCWNGRRTTSISCGSSLRAGALTSKACKRHRVLKQFADDLALFQYRNRAADRSLRREAGIDAQVVVHRSDDVVGPQRAVFGDFAFSI